MNRRGVLYDVGRVLGMSWRPVFDREVVRRELQIIRGIIPGRTFRRRIANLLPAARAGRHVGPLTEFLAGAVRTARRGFGGPLTYASLPFERVDWGLFDIVSVDHYRDNRSAPTYLDRLGQFRAHGKPVVVTEFGMRTYEGAESDGNVGTGITDWATVALHRLPLVGRFIRPRLVDGGYVRDESLQARRIVEDLAILEAAGVDGAFVCTFVEPLSTYSPDPQYDLDMGALSLVKSYADGNGTTYPDMTWHPKESFYAVADFYARCADRRRTVVP